MASPCNGARFARLLHVTARVSVHAGVINTCIESLQACNDGSQSRRQSSDTDGSLTTTTTTTTTIEGQRGKEEQNVALYYDSTQRRTESAKDQGDTSWQRKLIDGIHLEISDDVGQGASARLLGPRELNGDRAGEVSFTEEGYNSGEVRIIYSWY